MKMEINWTRGKARVPGAPLDPPMIRALLIEEQTRDISHDQKGLFGRGVLFVIW